MMCTRPRWLKAYDMFVPCGQCPSCRKQRATEWALRCENELSYHEWAAFVTLTYAPEALPANGDVDKKTVQDFLKRFRERIAPRRVKYYAVGEYGRDSYRPHYHLLVYGVKPCGHCWSCRKPGEVGDDPDGDCLDLRRSWSFGFVDVGSVEPASIRYVVGYIEKSLFTRALKGHVRPFALMSRGIGKRYCLDNHASIVRHLGVSVPGGAFVLPKAYRKWLSGEENLKRIAKGQEVLEAIDTVDLQLKAAERMEALKKEFGDDSGTWNRVVAARRQRERNLNAVVDRKKESL